MARDLSSARPLSVVVLGNSVAVLSLPPREGTEDGSYAEVLRDRLVAEGVPTRVHQEGRWFDFAVQGLRRYESSVRSHLPDVLVIHPRRASDWKAVFGTWSEKSAAERFILHVLEDTLPEHYVLDSSYPTIYFWDQGVIDVYVRKDESGP